MDAPQDFAAWLTSHEHRDPLYGWLYRYHSRSDAHSIALCKLVLRDLVDACPPLRDHALADRVVYGINARHTFPNGKQKTLDLAIGTPAAIDRTERLAGVIYPAEIDRVLIACEAKTCMTEHGKSQPRIFDELGSSHEIVHQGDREAIAAGITVVNIAATSVSPLRQKSDAWAGNTGIGSRGVPRALRTKTATSSSDHSAMKRKAEPTRYSRSHSRAIHCRPSDSAASPVVFEPAKMSITVSPGSVRNLMKNSGSVRGNRAG